MSVVCRLTECSLQPAACLSHVACSLTECGKGAWSHQSLPGMWTAAKLSRLCSARCSLPRTALPVCPLLTATCQRTAELELSG